ncbi:MAG: rod shape-determining protein RodA [Bacillota bacterium]
MLDRRFFRNIDYSLCAAVLVIIAIGLLMIYSTTSLTCKLKGQSAFFYVQKQLIFVVVGMVLTGAILLEDYRFSPRMCWFFYGATFFSLMLVLLIGVARGGAKSWFNFIFFDMQPSEFAKIGIILVLAKYLDGKESMHHLSALIVPFLIVSLPLLLVLKQPDFGTAMTFIAILFGMLFVAGARWWHLLVIVLIGILFLMGVFYAQQKFHIHLVKDYQIKRLTSFLNPRKDEETRKRWGYQVIQSVITVGSGQFTGKGYLKSTQGRLRFLPAAHTDFIFAAFCEEFGFLGASFLLALYFFVLWRGLQIASQARDRFGSLIATGVVSMLLFHVLINVGMNIGIMPITGIPLPLVSYGGSSLLASLIGLGLLLNVWLRRQKIMF